MHAELLKEHKRKFFGELGQCVSAQGFRAPRSDATGLLGRLSRAPRTLSETQALMSTEVTLLTGHGDGGIHQTGRRLLKRDVFALHIGAKYCGEKK